MTSAPIKVAVRLRPLVPHETGQLHCLAINENEVAVLSSAGLEGEHAKEGPWRFDHALDSSVPSHPGCVTNAKLYEILGRDIVEHALEGFNSCLFCYGQTGTGKTTTLLGDKELGPGVVTMMLKDLFEHKSQEESKGNSLNVAVQMLEVYNEKVFDLLRTEHGHDSKKNVQLHVLNTGVNVSGAELINVNSVDDCLRWIDHGNKRKHTAATAMNAHSSRGHTVIKFVIQHDSEGDGVHMNSEVYISDLAGHENEKTTQVKGEHLAELSEINKSLYWLQRAVHALASAKKGKHAHGEHDRHRMSLFRNSKLTLLLSNALLGNSLVHVIVTLSPAAAHFDTSLSSLKFANELKHVTMEAHSSMQVDPSAQIRKLEAEVTQLKEQLALATSNDVATGPSPARTSILAPAPTAVAASSAERIAVAENRYLRRELENLRADLRESQACVRALHADLEGWLRSKSSQIDRRVAEGSSLFTH